MKVIINPNEDIPDDVLEILARSLYPSMIDLLESDEGKTLLTEWQQQKELQ